MDGERGQVGPPWAWHDCAGGVGRQTLSRIGSGVASSPRGPPNLSGVAAWRRREGWSAPEPGLTQIIVELLPFRLGRLASLIFGPAIGLGIAELGGIALLLTWGGIAAFAPPIVSRDVFGCRTVVIGVDVNGRRGRQAQAHVAGHRWIPKAQPRNGKEAAWATPGFSHRHD